MSSTTATTGPPPLAACVRERITQLHGQGVGTFTLEQFTPAAERARRPLSWIGDHLIVLEGIGILRPIDRSTERAWRLAPGTEYLR